MQSLKDALNQTQLVKKMPDLEELKQEILAQDEVRIFLNQHSSEITPEVIDRGLTKLNESISQNQDCLSCASLATCTNLMTGFRPKLVLIDGEIDLVYVPCDKEMAAERERAIRNLIHTVHLPSDIKNATFAQMDGDDKSRSKAILAAIHFVKKYNQTEHPHGLYLYGPFGVGKTFLLGAVANQLAEQGVPSYIVHWPDYLRELKGSFEDNTSNQKIDALKEVAVLMIDDIGAESMTAWVRDEVLGSILQYRMHQNLPTFFTSNFDLKELEHHFTFSQNGGEEKVKAKRIMERIEFLTEPIEMGGRNRRK